MAAGCDFPYGAIARSVEKGDTWQVTGFAEPAEKAPREGIRSYRLRPLGAMRPITAGEILEFDERRIAGDIWREFQVEKFDAGVSVSMPDNVREFLVKTGLPLKTSSDFTWDGVRQGLPAFRVPGYESAEPLEQPARYLMLDRMYEVINLCFDTLNDWSMVLFDNRPAPQPAFVNSSIFMFALCLRRYSDVVDVPITRSFDEAYEWAEDQVKRLHAYYVLLDPPAMESWDRCYWPQVLDSMLV